MKSFFELYQTILRENPIMPMQPQPLPQAPTPQMATPQPGQGTSQPVPPPDPNLSRGIQALTAVKDPNFQKIWAAFQKQLQGAGIHVPGQPQPQTVPQQQVPSPVAPQANVSHA